MPTVHAGTIARAAQIVEPPSRVFLDAVDIILEYQLTHLESHIKPSPVGDDIQ